MKEFLNIDCMDPERGLPSYPDGFFGLAIVDPPYRDENQPTRDMRRNGSMKSVEGRPSKRYWDELRRVSKNQIIWGANNFQLPQFKGFVVWKKKTISEDFTMSMAEIASLSEGLSTVSKVVELAPQGTTSNPRIHPTQKPVSLYKWLLRTYANPNDLILDTHVGSASSLIACESMGFDYVGFEIDTDYYNAAKNRMAKGIQGVLL